MRHYTLFVFVCMLVALCLLNIITILSLSLTYIDMFMAALIGCSLQTSQTTTHHELTSNRVIMVINI